MSSGFTFTSEELAKLTSDGCTAVSRRSGNSQRLAVRNVASSGLNIAHRVSRTSVSKPSDVKARVTNVAALCHTKRVDQRNSLSNAGKSTFTVAVTAPCQENTTGSKVGSIVLFL